jgi:hypothetical protein
MTGEGGKGWNNMKQVSIGTATSTFGRPKLKQGS